MTDPWRCTGANASDPHGTILWFLAGPFYGYPAKSVRPSEFGTANPSIIEV